MILLNFWGTWCAPCRNEQPILNEMAARFAGEDVQIWGVAVGSTKLAVDLWATNLGVEYPLLLTGENDTGILDQYAVNEGIPLSVLIDRNGHIRKEYRGVLETGDQLAADIENLSSREYGSKL